MSESGGIDSGMLASMDQASQAHQSAGSSIGAQGDRLFGNENMDNRMQAVSGSIAVNLGNVNEGMAIFGDALGKNPFFDVADGTFVGNPVTMNKDGIAADVNNLGFGSMGADNVMKEIHPKIPTIHSGQGGGGASHG